jgi:hypothetical protein
LWGSPARAKLLNQGRARPGAARSGARRQWASLGRAEGFSASRRADPVGGRPAPRTIGGHRPRYPKVGAPVIGSSASGCGPGLLGPDGVLAADHTSGVKAHTPRVLFGRMGSPRVLISRGPDRRPHSPRAARLWSPHRPSGVRDGKLPPVARSYCAGATSGVGWPRVQATQACRLRHDDRGHARLAHALRLLGGRHDRPRAAA